ncbi:hypothetical protein BJF79_34135 [Actinomadura sp. CNU-125]|uniref:DUF4132 domain-containing protein n=1 Tax=Actinomadura sp. CNU-125 TaxID=1904961 RepID=UPI0009634365|nr:DUF4132 domain-containing protein [Actinomadura sp. CNU-125]OLT33929.1 hypothetical protein BJF79_34135 [Actinomadura sp. CNU-125]
MEFPDENVLTIPDTWRRAMHPRRDGRPVPVAKPGRKALADVRRFLDGSDGVVDALLTGGRGDAELIEAARRHWTGEPDPAGAAVIASVASLADSLAPDTPWRYPPCKAAHVLRAFVDAWTIEHGVAFAACALVELPTMTANHGTGGTWRGDSSVVVRRDQRAALASLVRDTARRVRALLTIADEAAYADAAERLAGYRTRTPTARWLVSYLVPTRRDWIGECLHSGAGLDIYTQWLRLCTVDDAAMLGNPLPAMGWYQVDRGVLATMVAAMGTAVLPCLLHNIDHEHIESRGRKLLFEAVALLPTDEAFGALVDRIGDKYGRAALQQAAQRFPVRGLRLLAAARSPKAAGLLAAHVRANAGLVAAVLPSLPDDVRAAVELLATASPPVPEAARDELPEFLTDPPWTAPVRPVVPGLETPGGREVAWEPGEREQWLGAVRHRLVRPLGGRDWEALAARHRHRVLDWSDLMWLLLNGSDEQVRPLLPDLRIPDGWGLDVERLLVARHQADMLPAVLRAVHEYYPGEWIYDRIELLMPFRSVEVVELMAARLLREDEGSPRARAWFERHGTAVVPYLAPAALGGQAKPRDAAETVLRRIAAEHGADAVADAFPEAARELRELLAAHPVQTGLARQPRLGGVDPVAFPPVLLRGCDRALPADAVRTLLELLGTPAGYAPERVRDAFDAASLGEFGVAVFRWWVDAGTPAKDKWALTQLGRTGDDRAVRELAPLIRVWQGPGGHRYAVASLDVLADLGSDLALTHLRTLAEKAKSRKLRERARTRIDRVARERGLDAERLADRLVPALGLDPDGSMTLDYGPRRFTVRFDERLRPFVTDASGRHRAALPKPGVKDDPVLAPAARTAFAALRKDVRAVAAERIHRLERAMVTGTRWTAPEFRRYFAEHPLTVHLARRLLWIAEDGTRATAFRVAEDRTLADVADGEFVLPEAARVGVVHPLHLDVGSLRAWLESFADYEILQPFEQLTRPVHVPTEEERDGAGLRRFEGLTVPIAALLALVRQGWEPGDAGDGGGVIDISFRFAPDRWVWIGLTPGFGIGHMAEGDDQTLRDVGIGADTGALRLGDLDPVVASEILADLEFLAAAAE